MLKTGSRETFVSMCSSFPVFIFLYSLAKAPDFGKAVAIAGISIGACTAFTACSPMDTITDFIEGTGDEILGFVSMCSSFPVFIFLYSLAKAPD